MHAKKIGGLPVMQGNHLVGIITVTDLLRMIKQCFGSGIPGLTITIRVRDDKGMLALITGEISRLRGNIAHLISYPDGKSAYLKIAMKLQDVTVADIIPLLTDVIGAEILSIHTWKAEDGPDFHDSTCWPEPQNRAKKLWFVNLEPN
jgi:acetoin utilization protein AcuB